MSIEFPYPGENNCVSVTGTTCDHAPHTFARETRTIWEFEAIQRMMGLLSEYRMTQGGIFVDVGAQVGLYALCAKFFPQMTFYAFEPFVASARLLRENIALNGLLNVTVVEQAVSHEPGPVTLNTSSGHNGLHTLGAQPERFSDAVPVSVDAVCLDDYFSRVPRKVDYIKVDTEGWELFVLRGGRRLLEEHRPILQLEINAQNMRQCQVSAAELHGLLAELNYKLAAQENNGEENFYIPAELGPAPDAAQVSAIHQAFWTPGPRAINVARVAHMASLELPLAGARVLETGCGGIGDISTYLVGAGALVTLNDARVENIAHLLASRAMRLPYNTWDWNGEQIIGAPRMFDAVVSYGTLYHLEAPARGLAHMAGMCEKFLLLSTVINGSEEVACDYVTENTGASEKQQSFTSDVGSRPSRSWVLAELRKHFAFVYSCTTHPDHPDYVPGGSETRRAIFLASRSPVDGSSPCWTREA